MAGAGGFTPESPIWRISREWALMLGGGRALMLQAAHPLALVGVIEHSDYEHDVLGRLRSTMTYVWTPAHRALLAGSAQYVKRAVVPLLPDLARALPVARRAEALAA